jgi:uncharacterized protein YbjQ (UPF0145 family)
MRGSSDVLVVNTSSIAGWEVETYIGPVSVHLVAGTNVFSDLFAGFSDIFGGRSESYGNQLSRLYADAVELLRRRARATGANVVLGLAIDFDEISGQGKSMFMLNAVGTAVRARRVNHSGAHKLQAGAPLTFGQMEVLIRRNELLAEAADEKLRMSADVWEFITEHAISELARYAMGVFLYPPATSQDANEKIERAVRYFEALDPDTAKNTLYSLLRHESHANSGNIRDAVVEITQRLHLVDYRRIAAALHFPEAIARKAALRLVQGHPGVYRPEDIADATALSEEIAAVFPARWTPTTRKGLLGGEKPAFACPCGGVVGEGTTTCPKCQTDTYGFSHGEFTRNRAIRVLEVRVAVLKEMYTQA